MRLAQPNFEQFLLDTEEIGNDAHRAEINRGLLIAYAVLADYWTVIHLLTPTERADPETIERLEGIVFFHKFDDGSLATDFIQKNQTTVDQKHLTLDFQQYAMQMMSQTEDDDDYLRSFIERNQRNIKQLFSYMVASELGVDDFNQFIHDTCNTTEGNQMLADVLFSLPPHTNSSGFVDDRLLTFKRNNDNEHIVEVHINRQPLDNFKFYGKLHQEMAQIHQTGFLFGSEYPIPSSDPDLQEIIGVSHLIQPKAERAFAAVGIRKGDNATFTYISMADEIRRLQGIYHEPYHGPVPQHELFRCAFSNIGDSKQNMINYIRQGTIPNIGIVQIVPRSLGPRK